MTAVLMVVLYGEKLGLCPGPIITKRLSNVILEYGTGDGCMYMVSPTGEAPMAAEMDVKSASDPTWLFTVRMVAKETPATKQIASERNSFFMVFGFESARY